MRLGETLVAATGRVEVARQPGVAQGPVETAPALAGGHREQMPLVASRRARPSSTPSKSFTTPLPRHVVMAIAIRHGRILVRVASPGTGTPSRRCRPRPMMCRASLVGRHAAGPGRGQPPGCCRRCAPPSPRAFRPSRRPPASSDASRQASALPRGLLESREVAGRSSASGASRRSRLAGARVLAFEPGGVQEHALQARFGRAPC